MSLAKREQFLQPSGTERWPEGTIASRYAFIHGLYQNVIYKKVNAGEKGEPTRGDRPQN